MSEIVACVRCNERFFAGASGRRVCGVCWPVDLDDPIDWAAVLEAMRTRTAVGMPARFRDLAGRDGATQEEVSA